MKREGVLLMDDFLFLTTRKTCAISSVRVLGTSRADKAE